MDFGIGLLLAIVATALLASWLASWTAAKLLHRAGILDQPNARSSHRSPVPRGGGIGFMAVIFLAFAAMAVAGSAVTTVGVLIGATLVSAISFVDDIRHTPRLIRLVVQAVAVVLALLWLPADARILSGLPIWLDCALIAIAWLWFINLFNFMDGIDGLAAAEAVAIAAGLLLLAVVWPESNLPTGEPAVVVAAALGFLILNWHPARLFMGDVGSAGLGFVLGWLLLVLAAEGYVVAALILPLFFIFDATTTIALRILRREPFAEAHRSHAYQRATDRGLRQSRVVISATIVNGALVALALLSKAYPLPAITIAILLTAAFTLWLRGIPLGGFRGSNSPPPSSTKGD